METLYEIKVSGVSPLLQNRFAGAEEVESNTSKRKSQTAKENNVEDTIYRLPDGTIYQPGEQIKQALINAAKAFKRGRSNMSTVFASFLSVEPEAIPHEIQKIETDRRAVVIPSTKGRVMRNRGRLNEWSLKFIVRVFDDNEIDRTTLQNVLEYAGKYIGIGDYRPQKKGMYGRFVIDSVTAV